MTESNIGETGIDSIRIGGKRIGDLSVVDRMRARKQVELSETERKIRDVKAKYPPYSVPHLKAGIKEARENMFRFETAIKKENETITEFSKYLGLCEQRDKELRALGVEVLKRGDAD